jgi:uncharacterized protein YegP (UPF0339 family)
MKFQLVSKPFAVPAHYFARIKGDNGETMFVTENYVSKQGAKHACEVVKSQASSAVIEEVTE